MKKRAINILLLSQNRVVQELVKIALKAYKDTNLEIIDRAKTPKLDRYDVILEEDHFFKEIQDLGLEHLLVQRYILLGDPKLTPEDTPYDIVIPKPFLPEDIKRVLTKEAKKETPKEESIQDFLEDEGIGFQNETQMLDEEDLKYIRSLLDGELMEESSIEVPIETKKINKMNIDTDNFFELLKHFQDKRCKKLLQGATINISIEFPKDK